MAARTHAYDPRPSSSASRRRRRWWPVVAFVADTTATTINGAAVRADGGVVRSIL